MGKWDARIFSNLSYRLLGCYLKFLCVNVLNMGLFIADKGLFSLRQSLRFAILYGIMTTQITKLKTSPLNWDNIPDDILLKIGEYFDTRSLGIAATLCTEWNRIFKDAALGEYLRAFYGMNQPLKQCLGNMPTTPLNVVVAFSPNSQQKQLQKWATDIFGYLSYTLSPKSLREVPSLKVGTERALRMYNTAVRSIVRSSLPEMNGLRDLIPPNTSPRREAALWADSLQRLEASQNPLMIEVSEGAPIQVIPPQLRRYGHDRVRSFSAPNSQIAMTPANLANLHFEGMTLLNLQGNGIQEPPALPPMPELTTLNLSHNRLEELPLQGCDNLRVVDLSHNNFEIFPLFLLWLPRLEQLDLRGNPRLSGGEVHRLLGSLLSNPNLESEVVHLRVDKDRLPSEWYPGIERKSRSSPFSLTRTSQIDHDLFTFRRKRNR